MRNRPEHRTPGDDQNAYVSSRDLVFDFAEFVADHNPLIPDASLLPHPRERLLVAYQSYHAYLSRLRNENPARFDAYGGETHLNEVGALWVMLESYRDVSPEDKALVDDINLGRVTDELRIAPMLLKYFCASK